MAYFSLHIVIGVYRCSHTLMDGILYLEVITAELSPICMKRVLS